MVEAYRQPNQSLVSAAMVLGILTLVSTFMMTVYLPFIFGGISIILAILSKGTDKELHGSARLGIILAVLGMVANTFIIAASIYTVFTNPEVYDQFNQMFSQIYGMNFEDMMSQMKTGGEFI